ncbi:hypothetical protein L211DRAFT_528873 [Terfezia boudieri ATCC MYA-4762]|uniref:Uncharacterized protein n=1 Tax=Terfezia boudieri ATCC MYA-4762 TaxID=1051890 RepID=A0A3N4LBC9_9PEZI|nr:hypothetical protein L211DRAFT_528873 [Terfezia boudieri ATCC MYA-4762]
MSALPAIFPYFCRVLVPNFLYSLLVVCSNLFEMRRRSACSFDWFSGYRWWHGQLQMPQERYLALILPAATSHSGMLWW